MQKEEIKRKDSSVMEGMQSIRSVIAGNRAGVNDRRITEILVDSSKVKSLSRELGWLKRVSLEMGFSIRECEGSEIDEISLGRTHGGILALCTERTISQLDGDQIKKNGFYVMIEGIEDPYNFGYALRSLYAAGVDGIVLDERNWMSAAGVVARSSAGASELFPVFTAKPTEAADLFSRMGYSIVCADRDTPHTLEDAEIRFPVFLIVGGERRGISRALLDRADLKVKISYGREFRAALSAASAATILAYEIFRQNRNK